MILTLDSGNTRIKWALADPAGAFGPVRAVAHGASLAPLRAAAKRASAACGCNVAGLARRRAIEKAIGPLRCTWVESQAQACGVRSSYRPGQLGADRWCALIGLRITRGWGISMLAGTAIAIDALARDGEFIGGLILPGRKLMHDALARITRLPQVAGDAAAADLHSTKAAIAAGSLHAAAGAAALLARRTGLARAPQVLCGGNAGQIAALLPRSSIDEHLVLRGAKAAAEGALA